ncbi:hypothetical protein TNCV_2255141 [Trichonephila clavipes]|nr:hypothetical protein TNCV_2255141 [Trichonephila clavipes]
MVCSTIDPDYTTSYHTSSTLAAEWEAAWSPVPQEHIKVSLNQCRGVWHEGVLTAPETPKYERYSSLTTPPLGYWHHGFNSDCRKPAPWCRHESPEHVWDALGRRVAGRQPPPTNSQELKELLWKNGTQYPNS